MSQDSRLSFVTNGLRGSGGGTIVVEASQSFGLSSYSFLGGLATTPKIFGLDSTNVELGLEVKSKLFNLDGGGSDLSLDN